MVSKALVVAAYQRKAEEIARLDVDLTVLVPPSWRDRRGAKRAEACCTTGYHYRVIPICFNGHFHLHYYPSLAAELARLRPHVLHMDEEPYNLATWLAIAAAHRLGIEATFFSWQNIERHYPVPFRWMEKANYERVSLAIAGSQEAAAVLAAKGFGGEVVVIPQFGVDPELFCPRPNGAPSSLLRIGYAGGLLPEKGVDLLLHACSQLRGPWTLYIAGAGSEEQRLRAYAADLAIDGQVHFLGSLPSQQMPQFYQELDVLVLPSRTTSKWKEQFGRVLVEAMACGVTVVGSNSGEIPHIISRVGLVFAEDNLSELRDHLQRLLDDPDTRFRLAQAGRRRVLDRYSMAQVAEQTVAAYRCLTRNRPPS